MRLIWMVAALALAAPAWAQQHASRADLIELAYAGYALALARHCGLWGDAAWHAEAERRIRLLAAHATRSRGERLRFEGAYAMAERLAREQHDTLGPIACRGVTMAGIERSYRDTMDDPRLDTRTIPPATED